VDGRKIAGTGGFFDGDTLFYQGTVLIDTNPETMMAALNVAQAKLKRHGLDKATSRVTNLRTLLGTVPPMDQIKQALLDGFTENLGINIQPDTPSKTEETLAHELYAEEIGQDAFVTEINRADADAEVQVGSHTGPGGTVTAYVRREGQRDERIREVLLTGDFLVTPPRTVLDLESHLRRIEVSDIAAEVEAFFNKADVGLLTISPADFAKPIRKACTQDGEMI